ncbi:MAG: adenylyltransferase/cytidyltransferase family protein [Lachnospiraceae bacterium]|nr:adenylyltransferase/cytidyltransferase family protein [Lachnospiraceae bacterium]
MRQLEEEYGIQNFSVYDSHQEYPRKLPAAAAQTKEERGEPKKYHIGYIAGVFDLFHVGHLNMFKRAKEQCDYLIVGVVSDESVMNNKKTMPCMSFEERIELVRACRYVDEAVEIPTDNGDTDEAYRRYHFDVQFSGSDYASDPAWLAKKTYLEKRGAQMVFFPYTQTTSSTKIKELIEKKLV